MSNNPAPLLYLRRGSVRFMCAPPAIYDVVRVLRALLRIQRSETQLLEGV